MQLIEGIKLDETNKEFNYAFELINYGHKLIYLTGRAGTGKTTFLKYLGASTTKNMVILAPTGVAAINAGGQTIHSFFQIDLSPYVPNDIRLRTYANPNDEDKSTIYDRFRYRKEKLEIIRGMDLLVIDEVSMVRCDLLDVIDVLLRVFRGKRNEPFGGVQVLLIGDTFQLPPVARPEVWEILEQFYKSPFFFSSKVIEQNKPIYIELKKVYRQHEQEFISLLNKVRVGEVSQDDLTLLNSKYNPSFVPKENDEYIILTTRNSIVNTINTTKLAELTSELHSFEAKVKDVFPDKMMPTEQILELKEGAQVMFVKNDTNEIKRYYNGKLAKIKKINEDTITVELSENTILPIDRQTWYNIEYTWNKEKKKIEEKVIGSFTQFPFKLAWAMSIHKSQGLTFDKVNADLGNAFAAGQVYVALSRCATFNGLVLKTKIDSRDIIVSPEALSFAKNETPETLMVQELDSYKNSYKANSYYQKVRESLKKNDFNAAYDNLLQAFSYRNDIETDVFKRYFIVFAKKLSSYEEKHNQLKEFFGVFGENNFVAKLDADSAETIENQRKEIERLNNKVAELQKIKENKTNEIKGYAGSLCWTLCNGVFSIEGHDEMPNYDPIVSFESERGKNERPWAFYLDEITSVIIGEGVLSIGDCAFLWCENLTSVTISSFFTNRIGDCAFLGCRSLTSIDIPASIENIGERAFDCYHLSSINVSEKNLYYSSEDGVLFNKDKTVLIQYPRDKKSVEYIIPDGVVEVLDMNCDNIFSITIPESLKNLEAGFFWSDGNLEHIYLQGEIPPKVDGYWSLDSTTCPETGAIIHYQIPVLHVPAGSKRRYRETYYWKNFKDIQENDDIPMVKIMLVTEKTKEDGSTYCNVYVANTVPFLSFRMAAIPSNLPKSYLETLKGTTIPGKVEKIECEPYEVIDQKTGEKKILNWTNKFIPADSQKQYTYTDFKDFIKKIDDETAERFVMYILNNGKVEEDTTIKEFLQFISNGAEYDVRGFVSKYPTHYAQCFPKFVEDENYTVNMTEAVIEILRKFSIEYDFLEPLAEGLSLFLKRFKELV